MNSGLLFAKYCDLKNLQEPHQNGLSRIAFKGLLEEYDTKRIDEIVLYLLGDKNLKTIKHLAKREIEDCKFRAYRYYDAGNTSEGDYGDWSDWEGLLVEFSTHILKTLTDSLN